MYARPKRRRLTGYLLVFLLGGAAGYYVRDARHDEQLESAVRDAREEMRDAGLRAIERARRAGENLKAGAGAAADSARAAFDQLTKQRE